MAIDKIFKSSNVDDLADNILSEVDDFMVSVDKMQQRKVAGNVQKVIQAFKQIETNLQDRYDNVTDVIEKRVLTIKDGRDGSSGSDGRNGRDGKPGRDGVNGKQGTPGTPGKDGVDGVDGVSVTDANIDFDGSLVISLSSGQQINVGEVVPPELERQLVELRQGGSAGSSGDVAGPTSSTDNAIVRFDGTTGKLVQNSVVTIADTTGNMAGVGTLGAGAITATSLVSSGTAASSFTVTSGTAVPLTITNVGTGNSFVVEDSASTDSTPFVIANDGRTSIGFPNTITAAQLGIAAVDTTVDLFINSNNASGVAVRAFKNRNTTFGSHTIVQNGDFIETQQFFASDGVTNIQAASISAAIDGTPGVNDMPGRLVFNTTADGASTPTEAFRLSQDKSATFQGKVGIGITPSANALIISLSATGSTVYNQVIAQYTGASDVTSQLRSFASAPTSATAAYTVSNVQHFLTNGVTIGAGSTVTNQFGFASESGVTTATNNYGFYSNIASGTNRYNFYAAGTAANFFAGNVGIGAALTNVSLYNTRNISGNSQSYGNYTQATIQSDVTSAAFGHRANLSTVAAAFTLSSLYNFYAGQGTIGAASAVTSQFGYIAENSLIGATNNYGFYSDIASGTNRYNFYANGTAANYFAGSVGIGAVPTSASKTSIVSTSAGASTIALALQNLSDTINTETVLDISCYSGTTPGVRSAQITALNVSGGTTVNMVFKISNGAVPAEAMRITSLGGLKIQTGVAVGAATPGTSGVAFPATAVAVADANTLDDYEEGTWTPTIAFGGLAVGVTYTANSGQYTKIGKVVYFQLVLTLSSKGSSTGAFTVLGLPFTPDSATYPVVFRPSGMTSGVGDTYLVARVNSSDTTISASKYSLGSLVALTDADFANTSFFSIAGFYQV